MSIKGKEGLSDVMKEGSDGVYVDITVSPDSSTRKIDGVNPWREELKVRVEERAEGGEANKAVVGLFADVLKLPENRITITKGRKTKHKRLFIPDVRKKDLERALLKKIGEKR
ncbi:MAG: DUF167 domain-containing protein [Candidatus Natronoplasma sp.]